MPWPRSTLDGSEPRVALIIKTVIDGIDLSTNEDRKEKSPISFQGRWLPSTPIVLFAGSEHHSMVFLPTLNFHSNHKLASVQ